MVAVTDGDALVRVSLLQQRHLPDVTNFGPRDDHGAPDVRAQFAEYFDGDRRSFELPLAPMGTTFQRAVWDALDAIAYGTTTTYAAVAARIDNAKAVRAVGLAVGKNPHMIIRPCHRVLGSNGSLTGYAGGLETKVFLLELESKEVRLTRHRA
jgi:methylated-DNA-[protein]-cysteine S-methyltransferase